MINVGTMIASAIFIVPAMVAHQLQGTGPIVLVWIVGGIVSLFGALSVGELGAAFPEAGGQYVYLREAYSPVWGFLYGWAAFAVVNPASIAAIAVAFATYLGFFVPLGSLAIMAILMLIEFAAISLFRPTASWPNPYVNANWGLLTFLIGACIAVPVMEEFVVRGFVFRGWSQSFGLVQTITVSSVLWALVHMQYDWFERFWIFVMGLALGYIRWRSNSTWLTVMFHSAGNIVIFFAMGLYP